MAPAYIQQILAGLLPAGYAIPPDLAESASNLILQSTSKINGLKPDQEAARNTICCQLAIEKYKSRGFDIPAPQPRNVPLPPKVYQNLLGIFRRELIGTGSPSKGSPVKTPTKRASVSQMFSDNPAAALPSRGMSPDDYEEDDDLPPTPSKRSRASPAIPRGLPKSSDPRPIHISKLSSGLGLEGAAAEAVSYAYTKYNDLVKDRWGLLCGTAHAIAERANPEISDSGTLENTIMSLVPISMTSDRLSEWVQWADKILGDQLFVRRITHESYQSSASGPTRKHSSGVGNMITGSLVFTSKHRKDLYQEWRSKMLDQIADLKKQAA